MKAFRKEKKNAPGELSLPPKNHPLCDQTGVLVPSFPDFTDTFSMLDKVLLQPSSSVPTQFGACSLELHEVDPKEIHALG